MPTGYRARNGQFDSFLVWNEKCKVSISHMTTRYDELTDSLLGEHGEDLGALISLELNDLTHFLILNEGAVASEFLLESLEELLGIVLGRDTLEGGDSFSTISLLNSDVNVIRRSGVVGGFLDDTGVGFVLRFFSYVGESV